MKIFIKAKLKAKEARVEKIDETHFEVYVHEPAVEGKANDGIIRALAEYFDLPPSSIRIVSGHASRDKIILLN